MENESQVLYAAVKTMPGSNSDVVSVALMQPAGPWFYAEVVDVDLAPLEDRKRIALEKQLRRVPGTTFVQSAHLGEQVLQWLGRVRTAPLVVRVETELTRKVLTPTLEHARAHGGGGVEVTWRICRFSNASLAAFYKKSGGCKPGANSLVDALGLAFCDMDRTTPMDVEKIHHLEMVMGTKGALGYRAWGRRYEAMNSRLSPVALAA